MNKIIFITGNRTKYAHLKYIAKQYHLNIELFREQTYHASYDEPRIYNRNELLNISVENAKIQAKKAGISENTLLLIEDTSVIIDALSDKKEVPGLDIKYWMKGKTIESINKLLSNKVRAVTVRSDIILFKINDSFKSIHTTGFTNGTIAHKEFEIQSNKLYPWLDNKTFNKWFIPEGEETPISMLGINDANLHDFRKKAFAKLYTLAQGMLKPQNVQSQYSMFNELIILTGHTCAGKTTLSQKIAVEYNWMHIEASDFMYKIFYEIHGITTELSIGDFAKEALKQSPEIVAKEIISELSSNTYPRIVISGFREPREVEYLVNSLAGQYNIQHYHIEAEKSIRQQRFTNRGRDQRNFEKVNADELEMGMSNHNGIRIKNNTSKNEFFKHFENLTTLPKSNFNYTFSRDLGNLQLDIMRFLLSKYSLDTFEYFTTTEISKEATITHHKDNISRFFNQKYSSFFEIKRIDGTNKFRLSNTGYSFITKYINSVAQ